jgi:hypothetical protein
MVGNNSGKIVGFIMYRGVVRMCLEKVNLDGNSTVQPRTFDELRSFDACEREVVHAFSVNLILEKDKLNFFVSERNNWARTP